MALGSILLKLNSFIGDFNVIISVEICHFSSAQNKLKPTQLFLRISEI
jgi:hypothetical protein